MKARILTAATALAAVAALFTFLIISTDATAQTWSTPPDRHDKPRGQDKDGNNVSPDPRVIEADIGDRIRWDFSLATPICEDDPDLTSDHGAYDEEQYHTFSNKRGPQSNRISMHEDFGLTLSADQSRLQGRLELPPKNDNRWVWRPVSNNSQRAIWRIHIRSVSYSDADHPDKHKEQCYIKGRYWLEVTWQKPAPTATPPPPPTATNTPTPTPTPTPIPPGANCPGNLRYSHWHGNISHMDDGPYSWNEHKDGGGYGDTNCMTPEQRDKYNFSKTGVHRSRTNPEPHDHHDGANRH